MATQHRLTLLTSVAIAFFSLATAAHAQPYGRGPGMMMGPGVMMGPGMMGRGAFGRMCGPTAAGFAEWRTERLEQVIKPTDAQRPKFDELKAASSKAIDLMRNACPTDYPRSMVARMELMEKRADAMSQAIKTMRPAMEAFYATLSDDQKARLDSGRGQYWRWRDRW